MTIADGLDALAGTHPERRFGRIVEVHATTASTQDLAKSAYAERGRIADGLVVTTHEQTSGRGTRGRRWWSPRGASLAVSIVVVPERPLARPACLTQLAALAVVRATVLRGGTVRVRWPNDVVDGDGAKVAGILAETVDGSRAHVIGIGVNVRIPDSPPPADLRERPGSMQASGAAVQDLGDALVAVLDALDAEWTAFERDGVPGLATRLNAHDGLRGRRVEIARGSELRSGTFAGVDVDLAPILAHDDGTTTVWPAEHVDVVAIDGIRREGRG